MARINLLPWREARRKEKQRQFVVTAAGSAILMALVVFYGHMHVEGLISAQEERNQFIKSEITKVEAKIREIRDLEKQKQQLIARMRVIEQLQRNRPEVVRLFQELVLAIPEGLHLTSLEQAGKSITIEGIAESNARVSSFMRALDGSPVFTNPRLDFIQADAQGEQRSRTFRLSVNQAGQSEPTE